MIEDNTASRLYLDANIFIYAIEGEPIIFDPLQELFSLLKVRKGIAVTSELILAEVLPRASDIGRCSYLNLILWSGIFDLHPVSRDVLIETADYRKVTGMPKLPDAIHAVTAIRAGCRMVLSRDHRLRLPDGYTIVSPEPANIATLIRDLA
ncbi:MAG: type II toxin-antitoxin system VapC family toxin [Rhizobiales bacterium]|nr:type II toxin-antitoxin system VapC family toxin [Hyphomicrobiales bacterium]